jgi:glycosyltransferase involved in cell wall biosynthesis
MKISIVIPAHNEANIIAQTLRKLEQLLRLDYEIVVVNDHSSDQTVMVVEGFCKASAKIRLVHNDLSAGFANALKTGFAASKGDLVVPVMADLCDDPATIIRMYEKINQGFDIVGGSRYMPGGKKIGGPKLKSFFSYIFGLSLYYFIGLPLHDVANSFKMYKRSVLDSIKTEAEGFEISAELPLRAFFSGYRLSEIPTTWLDRKEGESKFSIAKQGSRYFKLYLWAIKECLKLNLQKRK